MFQANLVQKAGHKTCWLTLLEFIFWLIWNERNQRIFKDKAHSPEQIAFKIQALLGESLRETFLPKNNTDLSPE